MKHLILILLVSMIPLLGYSQRYDVPGNWGIQYNRLIAAIELAGGQPAGDSLKLTSTHHATKGMIKFGMLSLYDEVANKWSVGYATPPGGGQFQMFSTVDGFYEGFVSINTGTSTNAHNYAFKAVNANGTHAGVVMNGPNTNFGCCNGLLNMPAFYSTASLIISSSYGDFQSGTGFIEFRPGGYADANRAGRVMPSGEWLLGFTADQGTYRLQVSGNAFVSGSITSNGAVAAASFTETITNNSTTVFNPAVNTHYAYGGAAGTWTLPVIGGNTNFKIKIKNVGTGALTVNSNGGLNTIFTTAAVNTTSIAVGSYVEFVNNGTYWMVE